MTEKPFERLQDLDGIIMTALFEFNNILKEAMPIGTKFKAQLIQDLPHGTVEIEWFEVVGYGDRHFSLAEVIARRQYRGDIVKIPFYKVLAWTIVKPDNED